MSVMRNALSDYDARAVDLLVRRRSGAVVGQYTILKSDSFPGLTNYQLTPRIAGASNYRKVTGFPIYGCAQPTLSGAAALVRLISEASDHGGSTSGKILWLNLREEATVYINGRPFVLRELDNPIRNVEVFRGASRERLEQLETTIKADILHEARRYGGMLLVHEEVDLGRTLPFWELIQEDSVMTTREMFEALQAKTGSRLVYDRLPMNLNDPPTCDVFDRCVTSLRQVNATESDTHAVVFSCQSGRSRTTFGMMIALLLSHTLVRLQPSLVSEVRTRILKGGGVERRDISAPISTPYSAESAEHSSPWQTPLAAEPEEEEDSDEEDERETPLAKEMAMVDGLPEEAEEEEPTGTAGLKSIWTLLRVLETGTESLAEVGRVCEQCAHISNMCNDIVLLQQKAVQETDVRQKRDLLTRAYIRMARYFFLVTFCEYLRSQSDFKFDKSFAQWVGERPEIESIYATYKERHKAVLAGDITMDDTASSAVDSAIVNAKEGDPSAGDIIKQRAGAVLTQGSILKLDWTPVSKLGHEAELSGKSADIIAQAAILNLPNSYRRLPGTNIHGVAQPTVREIRSVLDSLGSYAGPIRMDLSMRTIDTVATVNLVSVRIDALVYINGRPFVLRSVDDPSEMMEEYFGLDSVRLTKMETRLFNDINREADRYGHRVLAHERVPRHHTVRPYWETVPPPAYQQQPARLSVPTDLHQHQQQRATEQDTADAGGFPGVHTFAQVRDQLAREGYHVVHARAPLFLASASATAQCVDQIAALVQKHLMKSIQIDELAPEHFIFISGSGRTLSATAMTITGLLYRALLARYAKKKVVSETAVRPAAVDIPTLSPEEHQQLRVASTTPALSSESKDISSVVSEDESRTEAKAAQPVGSDCSQESEDLPEEQLLPERAAQPQLKLPSVVGSLLRLLPHGQESLARVDDVYSQCMGGPSFRARIWQAKLLAEELAAGGSRAPTPEGDEAEREKKKKQRGVDLEEAATQDVTTPERALARASHLLALYCTTLCFAEYIEYNADLTQPLQFQQWINKQPELADLLTRAPSPRVAFVAVDTVSGKGTALLASIDPANHASVVAHRSGNVLCQGHILKSDHFPGCQKESLFVRIDGAPNFRRADFPEPPVFGVANPTADGIRRVLAEIGAETVTHWTSLREEPIIFVNGRPYTLRELINPYRNLAITGIDTERLEAMEERLKTDIIEEAERYGWSVLLHSEEAVTDAKTKGVAIEMVSKWEKVSGPGDVLTPRDFYTQLAGSGMSITFHRIPCTDEKALEPRDVDDVVTSLVNANASYASAHPKAGEKHSETVLAGAKGIPRIVVETSSPMAFVYQCQMGQGRTTQGTIFCILIWRSLCMPHRPDIPAPGSAGWADFIKPFASPSHRLKAHDSLKNITKKSPQELHKEALLRGEYRVVLDLLKAVSVGGYSGQAIKAEADVIIDACAAIQNQRECVYAYQVQAETQPHLRGKALDFLERYFNTIAVNAYLHYARDELAKIGAGGPPLRPVQMADIATLNLTYESWLAARPEVRNLLDSDRFALV